jgi:hypothetical protein
MRRARTGLLAVIVVALAGCGGGGGHPRRDAVNAYFDRVDKAELPMLNQRAVMNQAFRNFSMAGNPAAEVTALRRARATILATEARVAAIAPPSDARKIHAELLALLHREASLTGELVLASGYSPQLARIVRPLTPAGVALARDLRHAKGWNAQAAAFAVYRGAIAPVLAQLEALRAPPVLAPALAGEIAVLRRRVALSTTVESALKRKDAKAANVAIQALFAFGSDAVRARRDEIAAAKAYNARIAQIAILTAAIAKERQKLIASIG